MLDSMERQKRTVDGMCQKQEYMRKTAFLTVVGLFPRYRELDLRAVRDMEEAIGTGAEKQFQVTRSLTPRGSDSVSPSPAEGPIVPIHR